mgnify:CR=1 FL=1
MDVQVCPNMKKVTLEKIVDVLENDTNEVILNDDFMQKALSPLKKNVRTCKIGVEYENRCINSRKWMFSPLYGFTFTRRFKYFNGY